MRCSIKKKLKPAKNILLLKLIKNKSPINPQINARYNIGSLIATAINKVISDNIVWSEKVNATVKSEKFYLVFHIMQVVFTLSQSN